MNMEDRFQACAADFELSYADDDWSRLVQHFTADASYDSGDGSEAATGRDAVLPEQEISIDRDQLHQLRSNDVPHLLSRQADPVAQTQVYDCFDVIGSERLLFSARIALMPLARGKA